MKAIVILRDGRRFECDCPDLARIAFDPPMEDWEIEAAHRRLVSGTCSSMFEARSVAHCYRSADENGVPVFRER